MRHDKEPIPLRDLASEAEPDAISDVRVYLVHPIGGSTVIGPMPIYEPGTYEPMPDGAFLRRWGRIIFIPWANVTHVEIGVT